MSSSVDLPQLTATCTQKGHGLFAYSASGLSLRIPFFVRQPVTSKHQRWHAAEKKKTADFLYGSLVPLVPRQISHYPHGLHVKRLNRLSAVTVSLWAAGPKTCWRRETSDMNGLGWLAGRWTSRRGTAWFLDIVLVLSRFCQICGFSLNKGPAIPVVINNWCWKANGLVYFDTQAGAKVSAVTLIDKLWLSTSSRMTPLGPFLAWQPRKESLSALVSVKSYSCSLVSHSAATDEF